MKKLQTKLQIKILANTLLHTFLKSQKASTEWEKSEEDEQILADLSSAYRHSLFSNCSLSLIVIV